MTVRPIVSALRKHKITAWLVILEIALTCAIVCNAVFLISQRLQAMAMPSGIAEQELLAIDVANLREEPDAKARVQEDLAALRAVPGVRQVSLAGLVPLAGSEFNTEVKLDPAQKTASLNAAMYTGENLLATLGTRLVAGRELQPEEFRYADEVSKAFAGGDAQEQGVPHTLVITQAMAEQLWPGQNPLGRQIYFRSVPIRVVGVVAHLARGSNLALGGDYSLVLPIRELVKEGNSFLIRTAPQDRARVMQAALAALKARNPHRVILASRNWEQIRAEFFQNDRAMAGLLVGICVALLLVTALGIFGLASFWVAQRRRTIGVRRALGATRGDILHYFQTENFLLASAGIVLGMVFAYGINLFLMHRYELPRLPLAYLPVGAALLWGIGQLAVLAPALRAAAVPPVVATRSV